MHWVKLGLLIAPPTHVVWMNQYAAVPTALHLGGDRYRIYFAGRDVQNRAQTGYAEIDLSDPTNVLHVSEQAVLTNGDLGTFDEHGAMVTWIVALSDQHYMYYTGWNRSESVPFRLATGLAISSDSGKTFQKYAEGPILDRSLFDPCFASTPCIIIENGIWRMWYASCIRWSRRNEQVIPHYHIKYAESPDGIEWKRTGIVCIDFKDAQEHAITRPCVIKDGALYRMWFCCRGDTYRIDYAESHDGITWNRTNTPIGIDISPSGWDSGMLAYPFVFKHQNILYMLYNGNEYGKTGIGLARMESHVD